MHTSPIDGTCYSKSLREALRHFLVHRVAVVWHLIDIPDLRHTIVLLLMALMPSVTCADHHWLGDVYGPEYWCRKIIY
jgi:hypothetical protein